jgi:hypothetical protein
MSYQIVNVPFSNTEVIENKLIRNKVSGMRGSFISGVFEIKQEVYEWLYDNAGMPAKSVNDVRNHVGNIWFTRECLFHTPEEENYFEFYFSNPDDAMLFKLTWCGL